MSARRMTDQNELDLTIPDQWRADNLEVLDWGTFSGLHTIPIAREGYLFVGKSGSGKSTLLDAISAVLIPKRILDFNAAARENEKRGKDRGFVSYTRGAWGSFQNDETGEYTTKYLRQKSTWSAIALRFSNGQGKTVTIVQIIWLHGETTRDADAKYAYLVFERSFALTELEGFDLDLRKLKKSFPSDFCTDKPGEYQEHFSRLLGIDNVEALKLLHKTQSSKNLGDLNVFLRDYMLERPETFDAAARFVAEFTELNEAHSTVVAARQQKEILEPAREKIRLIEQLDFEMIRLQLSIDGIEEWVNLHRKRLWKVRITEEQKVLQKQNALEKDLAEKLINLREEEKEADRALWEGGGKRIEELETELQSLETQRENRLAKQKSAEEACTKLGITLPRDVRDFAVLAASCRTEMEDWSSDTGKRASLQADRDSLIPTRSDLKNKEKFCLEEIRSLETQRSNIPADFLRMRKHIAEILGVAESTFPFAGELMEVRESEKDWIGAAERILHGFALSILVDEKNYPSFQRAVNSEHLGRRLVYFRVGEPAQFRETSQTVLARKIEVREGPWKDWICAELSLRFDHRCVETAAAFASETRALSKEGQVKHDLKRHEKDDRYRIDDRSQWVLGFNNVTKLEVFRAERIRLGREIDLCQKHIDEIDREIQSASERIIPVALMANLSWCEFDVSGVVERCASLARMVEAEKKGNKEIATLREVQEKTRIMRTTGESLYQKARDDLTTAKNALEFSRNELQKLESEELTGCLTPTQKEELDKEFRSGEELSLSNVDKKQREFRSGLTERFLKMNDEKKDARRSAVDLFKAFKDTWPGESVNLVASYEGAGDFMARLDWLLVDGLPEYESRFFELLQNQSYTHIANLSILLERSRKDILCRMELVNESLAKSPFGEGTWLRIDTKERHFEDVKTFRATVRDIQDGALDEKSADPVSAEECFLKVRALVARLSSQTDIDERWREQVLDVRQHMEFIAREIDSAGATVEVYQSGSGKSGGQRQKLATTCLAAALRYQLGGRTSDFPRFAMIVMDEAFDKADSEFTRKVMEIFNGFGFQMIMATPMKAIMSLEPYIGGACYIGITDRNVSGTLNIDYDADSRHLALPRIVSNLMVEENDEA